MIALAIFPVVFVFLLQLLEKQPRFFTYTPWTFYTEPGYTQHLSTDAVLYYAPAPPASTNSTDVQRVMACVQQRLDYLRVIGKPTSADIDREYKVFATQGRKSPFAAVVFTNANDDFVLPPVVEYSLRINGERLCVCICC